MAFRIDRGTLRPAKRTPTGIRCDAFISRAGVFSYRNPDGTERLELRDDAEVFAPESLASFEGVPVTDDHPPSRLDTANAPTYARGATGDSVTRDGDHVRTTITVFDAALIAKMDRGKVQISCGYECDLDETPGVHLKYGRYDARQINIRGNHAAVVDVGRAGPTAHARMDAAEMIDSAAERGEEGKTMDLAQALAALAAAQEKLGAAVSRADRAEAERDAQRTRADAAEAQRDAERTRADNEARQRTDAASTFDARVSARVALLDTAGRVLRTDGKPDNLTGKSDRDIMVAYVERVDGIKILSDKSDDYVAAYFASASSRADKAVAGLANLNKSVVTGGERADDDDPEGAALRRMNAERDARSQVRS